jgi:hypothetical protein
MSTVLPGMLRFEEAYQPRPWGGHRLATALGKPAPTDTPIGEAWLVSDHPSHVSRVAEGPWAGHTLHEILKAVPEALLGTLARPTPQGRFPLLLKLLDAAEPLSVQVHPDDHHALRLGEPDVGKTEMWYVLDADPQSCLYCGLHADTTPEQLTQGIHNGGLVEHLITFPATPGASVFVPAGTIHAIGAGILIAEIQQNSDLTYRLYDWAAPTPKASPASSTSRNPLPSPSSVRRPPSAPACATPPTASSTPSSAPAPTSPANTSRSAGERPAAKPAGDPSTSSSASTAPSTSPATTNPNRSNRAKPSSSPATPPNSPSPAKAPSSTTTSPT